MSRCLHTASLHFQCIYCKIRRVPTSRQLANDLLVRRASWAVVKPDPDPQPTLLRITFLVLHSVEWKPALCCQHFPGLAVRLQRGHSAETTYLADVTSLHLLTRGPHFRPWKVALCLAPPNVGLVPAASSKASPGTWTRTWGPGQPAVFQVRSVAQNWVLTQAAWLWRLTLVPSGCDDMREVAESTS